MPRYAYDAFAYEKRYRKVYEAGAALWEPPTSTKSLVKFLSRSAQPKKTRVVDIGCGEGRDSIFLSKRGFRVTGIDVSRSAVKRARQRSKDEKASADFLVADAINLPLRDVSYNLATNIGCLNLIVDQGLRDKHLREAYRILKKGGKYFSCNARNDESTSVMEFYRKFGKRPGTLIPRKVKAHGKEKELPLPIIVAWPKSREQYSEEFAKAGFSVVGMSEDDDKQAGDCWVLVAEKPS